VVWQRDTQSRTEAAQLTASLLQKPIDVDDAVRLALLNNPTLQVTFAELGIAEAEAVQSSLLRNPFLHLSVQTPHDAGSNALDFTLSWDVLGLFTLPLRQDAAEQAKSATRLQAAMQTLELAAQTRAAWYGYLTAQETVDLRQDMAEASNVVAEIARRLNAAGNQAGLARANTDATALANQFALADATTRTQAARTRLLGQLGLSDSTPATFPDSLPRLPETDPSAPDNDALETNHLDIARIKAELVQAEKLVASTRRTVWTNNLELGWDWSRDTNQTNSGEWKDGPSLGISLPDSIQVRPTAPQPSLKSSACKPRWTHGVAACCAQASWRKTACSRLAVASKPCATHCCRCSRKPKTVPCWNTTPCTAALPICSNSNSVN
jgi:outer membrane protein TolC